MSPDDEDDFWQRLSLPQDGPADPAQPSPALSFACLPLACPPLADGGPRADGGPLPSGDLPPAVGAALAPLLAQGHHLYAVLDGAATPNLRMRVETTGLDCRSLLQGRKENELAEVAPMLVRLAPPDRLTRALFARTGVPGPLWGRNAASLFVSPLDIDDLRAHLRKLTMLQTETGGWQYFRFYVPSVLHGLRPLLHSDPAFGRAFAGEALRAVLYQPPLRDHLLMLGFAPQPRGPAPLCTAPLRQAAARWVPLVQIDGLGREISAFLHKEDMALHLQFERLDRVRRFGLVKDLWRLGIRDLRQAAAIVSIILMTGLDLLREPAFFYATRNPFLSGRAKARQLISAYQMMSN
ncbi:DUF4123 domain-containing protein [Thioclava sp. GXIMD4215]|uniref:DUF4123 domain-containing protein n=1 Tax=Thioclava sp. GXIMD4215 TaxID=3131928 RepID=UPI00311AF5C8